MLGRSKKIRSSRIETLIGHSIEIKGDLRFSGGLHLDGRITGNVTAESGSDSVLVVSEQGFIDGDVHVPYAVINGKIRGNVYASEKLELSSKAEITGNVHYNLLEMASGSSVNGNMLHDKQEKHLLEHHKEPAVAAPGAGAGEAPSDDVEDTALAKG